MSNPQTIKVRARRTGEYLLTVRYPGDVFTLQPQQVETQEWTPDGERIGAPKPVTVTAEQQFSDWMERVPDDTPEVHTTAQEAINRDNRELAGGASFI